MVVLSRTSPRSGDPIYTGYGLFLLLILTNNLHGAPPLSPEAQRLRQQAKAKHGRSVAEMKREGDQRWKEMQSKQAHSNQKRANDFQRGLADRIPSTQLPPFNPTAAPSHVECLRAFILAARSATSMQQVLPYLPVDEQRALVERQQQYDPQVEAANRAWHKKQNPKIDERSLTYLSNPPFVNELERNKRIASRILEVLSVKVEGNTATISVSTNNGGTVNGAHYPFGTAEVELLG